MVELVCLEYLKVCEPGRWMVIVHSPKDQLTFFITRSLIWGTNQGNLNVYFFALTFEYIFVIAVK